MCRLSGLVVLAGVCGLWLAPACLADDWVTIRGRFVYDGEAPQTEDLEITRDEDFCGPFGLKNESLLVHPKNHGLQNVAIYLRTRKEVPVHPSYDEAFSKPVRLDNVGCQFKPRMQLLRTGQTWQATSTDSIAHNVAVYARRNDPFSQVIPLGEPLERVFAKAESVPVRIDCSIHAWMRAYVVITEHPYAAITNKSGEFEIAHVPAGMWTFRLWHERPGYLKSVQTGDQSVKLKAGAWELDVTGSELDLGELLVSSDMFAE